MLGSILVLFLLPFTYTGYVRNTTYRPIFKIFYWILIADFLTLLWVGQAPITDPYIALGQYASIYYFSFFTILFPIIGIVETKLVNYKIINRNINNFNTRFLEIGRRLVTTFLMAFTGFIFFYFSQYSLIVLNVINASELPSSIGKLHLVGWIYAQRSEGILGIEFLILSWVVMWWISILGFAFIYIAYKKDDFLIKVVLPNFFKLSLSEKFRFGFFTLFSAIPNKFWINVPFSAVYIFVISVIVYILGLVFPFLFFCYFMYLLLAIESFVFGLLYEYSSAFRRMINFVVFGNLPETFVSQYFFWFWGNMFSKGGKAAAAAAAAGGALEKKRQYENEAKIAYADRQTEKADKYTSGFKTPQERAKFHKER